MIQKKKKKNNCRGTPDYYLVSINTKGSAYLIHVLDISSIHLLFGLELVELSKPGLQGYRSGILEPEGINLYAYLSVDLWMSV
jgi:hypothetical protein